MLDSSAASISNIYQSHHDSTSHKFNKIHFQRLDSHAGTEIIH